MKKLLLAGVLMLVSVGANTKNYSIQEREDNCKRIAGFAESAMKSRQNGYSILSELKILEDINKKVKNQESYELMRSIVIDAYGRPSFMTEEYQKKAINDFSAKYYVECMALITK